MGNREFENRVSGEEGAIMCTVVGVCGHKEAAKFVRDGLHALQHRGQDSVGISVTSSRNPGAIKTNKALGVAMQVFPAGGETINSLVGDCAIGHDRYATADGPDLICAQPHETAELAFACNGDMPPAEYERVRRDLLARASDVELKTRNDGELEAHFLAVELQSGKSVIDAVEAMMTTIKGAYSAVFLYQGRLYAFRDPLGIRPLVLGEGDERGWYAVASEDCAFGSIGAHFLREVRPGELIVLAPGQTPEGFRLVDSGKRKQCIFDNIYFSHPSSSTFGMSNSTFRHFLGRVLAGDFSVIADVVVGVPDSSIDAAMGFAEATGIRYRQGLRRSHYVGRTFIEPDQPARDDKAKRKYTPDSAVLQGSRVVLVDDSIVRGTTVRRVVRMVARNGATAIHLFISSPPTKFSCFYGIATPDQSHLIAALKSISQIRDFISEGLDIPVTLNYLSVEDLKETVACFRQDPDDFCYACFDGNYPTPLV